MSISVRRFANLGLCTLLLLTLASTALADSLDQAKAAGHSLTEIRTAGYSCAEVRWVAIA